MQKIEKKEKIPAVFIAILRAIGLVIGAVVIGYLNWLVIRGWFGGQGPANLGSIEVSYVSMGRFLVDFGWKTWAPFWYFGFPFHLFYTPLLPVLEWLLNSYQGMNLWEAYRLITGWSYILAPVSVFFLGWVLSRRWIGGFISGILYSLVPTLFYFILPATKDSINGEVAADRFSLEFWEPRRFTVLVKWGEGPHTLSLVFLPLAGAFFILGMRKKSFWYLVISAIFLTLTALSNALGLLGALLLVGSIAFVHYARVPKRRNQIFFGLMTVMVLGLGLSSFWYNLSFISNFFGEGGGTVDRYLSLFPWGWLAIIFSLGLLFVVCRKFLRDTGFATAIVWFSGLFSVVYVYYASAPAELFEQRIELLPQALRYMTQVDLAFSILVGVFATWLLKVIGRRVKVAEMIFTLFLAVGMLYSFAYIKPFITESFGASSKVIDLSNTREKVIADILKSRIDTKKGERVFIPGNYGFYLNWFTDIWQHRGGLFQAATHKWSEHIHYQMTNGFDKKIAEAWLKAMNVKYAVVTATGSAELYKEMKNLERFEDLPITYQDGGDLILETPLLRPSLAKPVSRVGLERLVVPSKADDKQVLLTYVDWVERSSSNTTKFEVIDNDSYRILGVVDQGEIILVQMTADSGWRASDVNTGKRIRTGKDPLGFLVLYSEEGEVDIELIHGRSLLVWLGYLTSIVTIFGIIWYGIKRFGIRVRRNKKIAE